MSLDQRVDESILPAGSGHVERFLALHEFEPEARQRLPRAVYEYVAGGAGEEYSIRANEESYQRILLRPRVLRSVGPVDLSQELLGRPLPVPVVLAPAAYQRLMHLEGELGSVRGAISHAVPFVLSSNATVSIEETTAVPGSRCWFQLYVQGDRGFTRDSIARVEAAGCEAVCVTVDTPVLGLRPRQLRAGFKIPAEVPLPHAAHLRAASDPGRHSALTWCDVDWLRSVVKSKLLLKGILHPADAELAIQAGVDGIVVSNHGGRNLDTVIPPIEALPDITQQVAGRVPLLVDGGIRRGTDALKALIRGANAVLIGRPYLYALAVGGSDGVARCLSLLVEELRLAMALVGAASLQNLSRDIEWVAPAAFGSRASPGTP
ncbi:MAG: alpha-hydroxy-acid oxidizing protein [Verrucomicrobia bacterium]|nr:alpha-hydroxy-acid oxidizing protein [Verrucomicrobiota bacterium]